MILVQAKDREPDSALEDTQSAGFWNRRNVPIVGQIEATPKTILQVSTAWEATKVVGGASGPQVGWAWTLWAGTASSEGSLCSQGCMLTSNYHLSSMDHSRPQCHPKLVPLLSSRPWINMALILRNRPWLGNNLSSMSSASLSLKSSFP